MDTAVLSCGHLACFGQNMGVDLKSKQSTQRSQKQNFIRLKKLIK